MAANDGTKKVAILIENDVEDVEFLLPYNALKAAGAEVTVLGSRMNEEYQGKQKKVAQKADATTTDALAAEFDAVIIPGGGAPDKMRTNMKSVRFVRDAIEQNKLVAAVCHGPQLLIEADVLRGRRATGFRAIRKDMQNAGANFVDESLVVDGNLITSRQPGDVPIFVTAIINRLGLNASDPTLPGENDKNAAWWTYGEKWGGSTKAEIAEGINTALRGERYAIEAFDHYAEKVTDAELRAVFQSIAGIKRRHVEKLEGRLAELGEKQTFQAAGSGAWATLKSWLQSSNEEATLRRALGDLQTGVVDAWNLHNQFTDPQTTAIFNEILEDIAAHEQRVADLYHAKKASDRSEPAQPTTGAAVSSAS